MFNPILDNYPDNFEGYLIRSSFRVGMQIMICLESEEYQEYEKMAYAIDLLYGEGKPDSETALRGLMWFLSGGNIENQDNVQQDIEQIDKSLDFNVDASRITTAFKRTYNIDLATANLHWFEFLNMLGDLGDCAHIQVMNYRVMKVDPKMPAEQKSFYQKMKRKYALTKGFTEKDFSLEEQEQIDIFDSFLNGTL